MYTLWHERIKAGSGQCLLTDVGSSSVGNLDVNYNPRRICCMHYKKGLGSAARLTRENCKPQAAPLFLEHNRLEPSRMNSANYFQSSHIHYICPMMFLRSDGERRARGFNFHDGIYFSLALLSLESCSSSVLCDNAS